MTLATQYSIHPKTVVKCKKRNTVKDAPLGPEEPTSTVLTKTGEAAIAAFHKYTVWPLDDC